MKSATLVNDQGAAGQGSGGRSKAATVSIASISDQDWYISRTYGVFHIPACPTKQAYALLLVTPRGDALDLGDSRRYPVEISARDIAKDLVQDLENHGVFVCGGARPTSEELSRATAGRDKWYEGLVFDGDQMWARSHNHREISDMHRRAVLALGLEREWAYTPKRMVDCPVCGEKIKPEVALCRHCNAVIDAGKAARHGITAVNGRAAGAAAAFAPQGQAAGNAPRQGRAVDQRD